MPGTPAVAHRLCSSGMRDPHRRPLWPFVLPQLPVGQALYARVPTLRKNIGLRAIIHGMDRNASTPLQKQAARALPYPCRGAFYMLPRASNARPYPFFTRRWHRSWTARGRWGRRRCSRARPCWASSNPRSSPPGRDSTFQKFHGTAGFPW